MAILNLMRTPAPIIARVQGAAARDRRLDTGVGLAAVRRTRVGVVARQGVVCGDTSRCGVTVVVGASVSVVAVRGCAADA